MLPDAACLVEPAIRAAVRARLRDEHGVQTTVYPATHSLGGYIREFGAVSLPRTEDAAAALFSIPLFPHMEDAEQQRWWPRPCSSPSTHESGGSR